MLVKPAKERPALGMQVGITLIELIVVMAVIGILVTIAYPSYIEYMKASRRADAMHSLMEVQLMQEKWRRNDVDYGTEAEIDTAGGWSSQEGFYTIRIISSTTIDFTATAIPVTGQSGDSCGTFAINRTGPDTTGSYANDRCWKQ